jgi:hypothetical protein
MMNEEHMKTHRTGQEWKKAHGESRRHSPQASSKRELMVGKGSDRNQKHFFPAEGH